ncbi:MAG: hypothetical protein PHX33_07845 [Candidatus Cloacimonetes bacterium]|nr:hypothetical protein [Candidatus Cloacimonadota bacterium]
MIKKVIDEKLKQNQDLKEYFEKLGLSNESIVHLITLAINDLETIKFLYLFESKDKEKEKTNDKTSN